MYILELYNQFKILHDFIAFFGIRTCVSSTNFRRTTLKLEEYEVDISKNIAIMSKTNMIDDLMHFITNPFQRKLFSFIHKFSSSFLSICPFRHA